MITVDGVRSVLCISNTKGARADRPSCNPPNELVPSVRYNAGGRAHEGCWNQGLVGAKHHLSGGQVRFADGYMVVSDFNGGLDVFNVQNSRHVARVDGTQASAGNAFGIPGSLSAGRSRLSTVSYILNKSPSRCLSRNLDLGFYIAPSKREGNLFIPHDTPLNTR